MIENIKYKQLLVQKQHLNGIFYIHILYPLVNRSHLQIWETNDLSVSDTQKQV